jgi:hypothetical protein
VRELVSLLGSERATSGFEICGIGEELGGHAVG